jgi:hypothetical protein
MSNTITASTLASNYAALSALDVDQRWSEWSTLYASFRDRPKAITLADIVKASKGTDYPLSQSAVQDCILAAGFTDNPHAAALLTDRFAGKRPTRVHTMVRAALVALGKGATGSVRDMAALLASDLDAIANGKKKDKEDAARKRVRTALADLVAAGKSEAKPRKARPEGVEIEGDPVAGDAPEQAPKVPLTGAEYLAAASGPVTKFGEIAANGKATNIDREAWAAFRDQVTAIDAIVNSNRAGRRTA